MNIENRFLINLLVAASNIAALPAIFAAQTTADWTVAVAAATASVLMHLSERKHGLPGIPPFNWASWFFLQLDRAVAYGTAAYLAWAELQHGLSFATVMLAANGLAWMGISECLDLSVTHFAIAHVLWHVNAFAIMYRIFTRG
jgi:hypothetical protein